MSRSPLSRLRRGIPGGSSARLLDPALPIMGETVIELGDQTIQVSITSRRADEGPPWESSVRLPNVPRTHLHFHSSAVNAVRRNDYADTGQLAAYSRASSALRRTSEEWDMTSIELL